MTWPGRYVLEMAHDCTYLGRKSGHRIQDIRWERGSQARLGKGPCSCLTRTLPAPQVNDDQSPSTLNYLIHLQERPVKQTISR